MLQLADLPVQKIDLRFIGGSLPRRAALENTHRTHFLRNALYYVPRRVDDDCLQELRWVHYRPDLPEARRALAAWLVKWSAK